MQIRAFQLHNYGRFESLSASFMENESTPAKVVVLVGNNGAGKTTILKALATSLSWLVGKVRSERGVGKPIADHAILNGASSAAIQLFMTDDSTSDSPLQWIIGRSRTGRKIEIPSQLHDAATLAQTIAPNSRSMREAAFL